MIQIYGPFNFCGKLLLWTHFFNYKILIFRPFLVYKDLHFLKNSYYKRWYPKKDLYSSNSLRWTAVSIYSYESIFTATYGKLTSFTIERFRFRRKFIWEGVRKISPLPNQIYYINLEQRNTIAQGVLLKDFWIL